MSSGKENQKIGWYSLRENNTVIIFIHGFLSDSIKCWTSNNGEYWPNIVRQDKLFAQASIFLAGFHTSIDSGIYDIAQCSAELKGMLELKRENKVAPLDFHNILFVCHSLGGIICRRLLEENSSNFNNKSVGILLVASPSLGSIYANELSGISKLYGNQIAQQIKTNSELLKDIDNRFRNLIIKNPFNKFVGAEICEQNGPFHWKYIPIRMKPIVDANSASRYFGQTRIIPGTDHTTIAKPNSAEHPSHQFFQIFYQNTFEPIRINRPSNNFNNSCYVANPDPLFEVYSKPHQTFYVSRNLDDQILDQLKQRSLWIFGSSGVGKTSLAKYAIEKISAKTVEIHLGHIEEEKAKEQLLTEIIYALNPDEATEANNLNQRAIQLITQRSRSTMIPIFLDEVPISSNSSNSIIAQTLGNLLDSVKQTQIPQVSFMISSIVCPPNMAITPKMRDQIKFLEVKYWDKEDIERLFDMIAAQLNISSIVCDFRMDVVTASAGLPRFVKSFFRNITRQNSAVPDLNLALLEANQEAGN